MAAPFLTQRRIEFRDTDAAGIAHFSVFFTYMETVEHELLRSLNLSVMDTKATPTLGWPRVSASCEYRRPARFEDVLDISAEVQRMGNRSITYRFLFRLADQIVAEGTIVAACCHLDDQGRHIAVPIPEEFRLRLASYCLNPAAG